MEGYKTLGQGRELLLEAAKVGDSLKVEQVLKHADSFPGAESFKASLLSAKDEEGRTPLMLATLSSLHSMRGCSTVCTLLENGAKIDAVDKDGRTAVMIGADAGASTAVAAIEIHRAKHPEVCDKPHLTTTVQRQPSVNSRPPKPS